MTRSNIEHGQDDTPPRAIDPLVWSCDVDLTLPGSKSEANRLLVIGALSGKTVNVIGATPCDDVRVLVRGLSTLGFHCRFLDEARGTIEVGPRRDDPPTTATIDCGNAGTALRFLVSVAAITPGTWTITGDLAMQRRPIGPLVSAWRRLGVEMQDHAGCPPVTVRGGARRGGGVQLDASRSSQFLSSLLLVGSELEDGLDIELEGEIASLDYATLTCELLRHCGIEASIESRRARVRRIHELESAELEVRADWSAAATWSCLSLLTGSIVHAANLRRGSHQPDEHIGDLLRTLSRRGDVTISLTQTPDQFMNIAIVAALRRGTTHLVDAANLRVKESDRIAVMARELAKVGVPVREFNDGLEIDGGQPLHGALIDPENDHRVAIAFALLGLLVPGISIANPRCVEKSYPGFWDDLERVQRSPRCVAIIGMRGAGKSTLGRGLATRAGVKWIDTDHLFEHTHGPIAPFVALHGWEAFRRIEAHLVAESLLPGNIVSTGGGAIEDPQTRALLRENAFVLALEADAELLQSRLRADARPRPALELGENDPIAEIPNVLERRRSLYASTAHIRLSAAQNREALVEAAFEALHAPCRFPR